MEEAIENARDSAKVIQKQLPIVREHFMGDPEIINGLEEQLDKLAPMRQEVLTLASQNRKKEAAKYMEANNIPTIHAAQAKLDLLIENGNIKGEELINNLRGSQKDAIIMLGLLGFSSLLISVVFCVYITKAITVPVSELEQAAGKLEHGQLSSTAITYTSRDELGHLADSMRSVVNSLPVSYTHLLIESGKVLVDGVPAKMGQKVRLDPVSYTHLDVYKRQWFPC